MLLLANTTDKLQLVTSAAVTVDVHASYMDHTTATDDVVGNRQNTAITTAATTDIVAAPGAGVVRNVKTLHVRNKHSSLSVAVTVVYNANATDFELNKVTLLAGETLEYIEGIGFFTIVSPVSALVRVKKLAADQSNSTSTATEVAGLALLSGLGTFFFDYRIIHRAAATTTGIKFSVNHDGTVTQFAYWVEQVSANTLAADGVQDQDVALATGGLINVNAARAKGVAGLGASVSVDTANADMLTKIEGIATVTVDGNFELWHGSEVAAASTVMAGSSLFLTRTGD